MHQRSNVFYRIDNRTSEFKQQLLANWPYHGGKFHWSDSTAIENWILNTGFFKINDFIGIIENSILEIYFAHKDHAVLFKLSFYELHYF